MSLDFNYRDCDDNLLTDEHYEQTCQNVMFHTIFVGMPKITKENWSQFAMRCAMFDQAGNFYDYASRTPLEWADVIYPWIGLTTNASPMTDAEFAKKIKEESERTMLRMRLRQTNLNTGAEVKGE